MTVQEQLIGKIGTGIEYHTFLKYLWELEEKGLITLYAGTYSLRAATEMEDIEQARFYFYCTDSKSGFCFRISRMGASLKKDDALFTFSHRRLYSKRHLSNCFFGETDLRSGAFFGK